MIVRGVKCISTYNVVTSSWVYKLTFLIFHRKISSFHNKACARPESARVCRTTEWRRPRPHPHRSRQYFSGKTQLSIFGRRQSVVRQFFAAQATPKKGSAPVCRQTKSSEKLAPSNRHSHTAPIVLRQTVGGWRRPKILELKKSNFWV